MGKGDADAHSNIDVILYSKGSLRALDVLGIAEKLHRASGKAVDVYEISELKDGPFRDTVLKEALPL